MLDCGLRPEEVYRLKCSQIADGKTITVFFGKGTGSRRSIEMTSRVAELFCGIKGSGEYLFPAPTKEGHIVFSSVRKQHRNTLKKAGLDPFVIHSLRHTCLTRWAAAVMDAPALQYLAGHESITTTMKYIHFASTDVQSRLRTIRAKMAGA